MERDRTDPPLTVADLDAIEADLKAATSGRLTDDRGDGSMGTIATVPSDVQVFQAQSVGLFPTARDHEQRKANARALVSLWNASTPLLALARRGLEAEQGAEDPIGECEACGKPATRSDEEGVPLCEACYGELVVEEYRDLAKKHEAAESKLAAALAEVERVRGQLACAKRFDLPCGAEVYMSKKDNANTYYLLWARGDFSDARYNTLDAAWSAAAEAQAGQAAKQGGEGDSHEAR